MADETKRQVNTPLLEGKLSIPEQVMLHQVVHHGGFKVLIKLFDAACEIAGLDALRLDPEDVNYNVKLAVRTQRARNFAEFVDLTNKSVVFHTESLKQQEDTEEDEAKDAVRKVYGINILPKKQNVA